MGAQLFTIWQITFKHLDSGKCETSLGVFVEFCFGLGVNFYEHSNVALSSIALQCPPTQTLHVLRFAIVEFEIIGLAVWYCTWVVAKYNTILVPLVKFYNADFEKI